MSKSPYLVRQSLLKKPFLRKSSSFLNTIVFELTERCNNRCIHCYINQDENDNSLKSREMSSDWIRKIVSEATDLGCMNVKFTGGEPLLREDFSEIYLNTRRCGVAISLLTNATLIDDNIAALFQKYPPGKPVEITLYGMSESGYRMVSGIRHGFNAAMAGVKRLTANKIPFILKGIYLNNNFEELQLLEEFARNHCFKNILPGFSTNFNLRARKDNEKKDNQIKKLRATPEETLALLTRDTKKYIDDRKIFAEKYMRPPGELIFNCGCGNSGTIDAYGRLQPCLLLRHPDVTYNLTKGSLQEALEQVFPQMRKMKAQNPDYLKRCAKCFLHGLCEQCAAHSWMEHGTLDTPVEYLCEIAHAQAIFLGLLDKTENSWEISDWQKRLNRFTGKKLQYD